MQTFFSLHQLRDPALREADDILRSCVHCGFCLPACPTYRLTGDERDSPRGRIYLMKGFLESGQAPSSAVGPHLDRCLSCLGCMTACPSGVDYRHLIDHARPLVRRRWGERLWRWALSVVLPRPALFRLALLVRAPRRALSKAPKSRPIPATGPRRMRIALMPGCVQPVLRPEIDAAALRLLARLGAEVVTAPQSGCCGAIPHHLGRPAAARRWAKSNIATLETLGDLDAILITASGCGTMLKDYGHLLHDDPVWRARAARMSALCRDLTEIVAELGLSAAGGGGLPVAVQTPCSLQHGQNLPTGTRDLLAGAGFDVREPVDSHLCCGSAGTYSLLQPEMSARLGRDKAAALEATGGAVVASGNIGCLEHLAAHGRLPVVHTAELLDWATGGPRPAGLPPSSADGAP